MEATLFFESHKHHFRNPIIKDGKADLYDDDKNLIYSGIEISATPENGKCVIIGGESQPIKTKTIK